MLVRQNRPPETTRTVIMKLRVITKHPIIDRNEREAAELQSSNSPGVCNCSILLQSETDLKRVSKTPSFEEVFRCSFFCFHPFSICLSKRKIAIRDRFTIFVLIKLIQVFQVARGTAPNVNVEQIVVFKSAKLVTLLKHVETC